MKPFRYLFIPLFAISIVSCKQKPSATAGNNQLADTVNFVDTAIVDMPGDKPVPLAQLIVPGISVGQTAINESLEVVHKKLGKPDGGDAAMGKSISFWYANHDTSSYVTQIYFTRDMGNDETARVKEIRVTSPSFKISSKIHTGLPFNNIKPAYTLSKTATYTYKGSQHKLYDDVKAGVGFEVDDKDVIAAIVVHETGTDITTNYQGLFLN
ncbi:hypothetical protein EWM62_15455 [Mucilaginibacter terrigena]|uniref:Lipoprotein n=1 Tax=Mucilaginibacter terrigena TaxID=2492395 RepID=A0A4V1ZBI7_9SPHI|nr:hypothetical protein [Mucilaginibacter terrigena]RYU87889.1 hypothetical protein EWM62_15455 [Mucilaginibacter terrigena]